MLVREMLPWCRVTFVRLLRKPNGSTGVSSYSGVNAMWRRSENPMVRRASPLVAPLWLIVRGDLLAIEGGQTESRNPSHILLLPLSTTRSSISLAPLYPLTISAMAGQKKTSPDRHALSREDILAGEGSSSVSSPCFWFSFICFFFVSPT